MHNANGTKTVEHQKNTELSYLYINIFPELILT